MTDEPDICMNCGDIVCDDRHKVDGKPVCIRCWEAYERGMEDARKSRMFMKGQIAAAKEASG